MQIDILLHSKSQYGVIDYFEKGLQEAFIKQGILSNTYPIDQKLPEYLLESSADYTLGVNVVLPDHLSYVPHIAYMIDWVTYTPSLFSDSNMIVCNVDKQSAALLEKFVDNLILFLPHAISESSIIEEETKRDIDLVFAGSYMDENLLYEKLKVNLSQDFLAALEEVISKSLTSSHINHVEYLSKLLEDFPHYGKELEEKQITTFTLCNTIEQMMRARDRMSLLKAIDREVHIYGNDCDAWKQALHKHKNFIFHPPIEFKKINTLFQRSKIVLNSAPMFKEGLHERFLYALANGASVITNQNILLSNEFPEDRSLKTFIAPDYRNINHVINNMLESEEERIRDVKARQAYIKSKHTWDERVKSLLNVLQP